MAFFYIPYVDGSFYRIFLGAVLLIAALTNENIRKGLLEVFSMSNLDPLVKIENLKKILVISQL